MNDYRAVDDWLRGSLSDLLGAHGVGATSIDGGLHLPEVGTVLTLRVADAEAGRVLLEARACAEDDVVVMDHLLGLGDTLEAATRQALAYFCTSSFHVLLASHGGLLERAQVEHEGIQVGQDVWDLYAGPWVSRHSAGAFLKPYPDFDRIVRAIRERTHHTTHFGSFFAAVSGGSLTLEATWDGHADPHLGRVLESTPWDFAESGYASQRMFFVIRKRIEGRAAHIREGECTS